MVVLSGRRDCQGDDAEAQPVKLEVEAHVHVEHRRWQVGPMPQLRPLDDLPLEGEVVVGHPRGRPRGRSQACSTRSQGGTPRTGERPLRGPRARILLSTDRWPDEEVDGVMGGGWPCGEGEVVGIVMGEGSVWQ